MSDTILENLTVPLLNFKFLYSYSFIYIYIDCSEEFLIKTRKSAWVLYLIFQNKEPEDIMMELVDGTLIAKCRLAEADHKIRSCSSRDI